MRPLAAAVLLLAACGNGRPAPAEPEAASPSTAAEPSRSAAETDDASAVLAELRAKLQRTREAAPDAHVVEDPVDAAPLVGMHRGVIERALGAPHDCSTLPTPTAPCEQPGDVFYSFYHLPEGSNGGGPELLLRYDAAGRCTQALWRFTQ